MLRGISLLSERRATLLLARLRGRQAQEALCLVGWVNILGLVK